jgi:uncharacterized membrane protein
LFIICSGAVGLVACGDKYAVVCEAGTEARWPRVEAIFARHCVRCHATALQGDERSGAPERVNYDSFESARRLANSALAAMREATMPEDDPGAVTDSDICTLDAWIDGGRRE